MADTGYSRDSERILLALYEQTELTTREVAEEAGLSSTQAVHYRYKNYLGPEAYGLVEKVPPEPGEQALWRLTESGEQWVDVNHEDIEIPQTEDEAIEVAAKALEQAKSASSTAGSTAGEFHALKEELMMKVGDVTSRAEEALELVENANTEARNAAQEAAQAEIRELVDEVGELRSEVEELNKKYSAVETAIDSWRTDMADEDSLEEVQNRLEKVQSEVSDQESRVITLAEKTDETDDTAESALTIAKRNRSQRVDLRGRVDDVEDDLENVEVRLQKISLTDIL